MKPNPILDEVWKTKDELAREANNDLHQLCEDTRRWAADRPHTGPVIRNAEELQQFIAEKERQQNKQAMAINEETPKQEHS